MINIVGLELLNNSSSIIQGVKYISNSLRNHSFENKTNKYVCTNGLPKKIINLKSYSIKIKIIIIRFCLDLLKMKTSEVVSSDSNRKK